MRTQASYSAARPYAPAQERDGLARQLAEAERTIQTLTPKPTPHDPTLVAAVWSEVVAEVPSDDRDLLMQKLDEKASARHLSPDETAELQKRVGTVVEAAEAVKALDGVDRNTELLVLRTRRRGRFLTRTAFLSRGSVQPVKGDLMFETETTFELQPVGETEMQPIEGGAYHPLTLVMLVGPAGLGAAAAAWYLKQ